MNPYIYEFSLRGCFYAFKFTLVYILTQYYEISPVKSFELFALLTAQCFISPLISGYIADKYAKAQTSFLMGIALQLAGFVFVLNKSYLEIGFSLIVIAFGITKTGILKLLKQSESYQDSHVTKLYAATNLSAFLIPLVTGYVGENYGWNYSIWLILLITLAIFSVTIMINIKNKSNEAGSSQISHFGGFTGAIWLASYASFYLNSVLLFLTFCIVFILATHRGQTIGHVINAKIIVLSIIGMTYFFFAEQPNYSLSLYILEKLNRSINGFIIPANAITGAKTLLIFGFGLYLGSQKSTIKTTKNLYNYTIISTASMFVAFIGFAVSQIMNFDHTYKMILIIFSYSAIAASEIILIPTLIQKVLNLNSSNFNSLGIGVFYACASLGMFFAKYVQKIFLNQPLDLYKFLSASLLFIVFILILVRQNLKRST